MRISVGDVDKALKEALSEARRRMVEPLLRRTLRDGARASCDECQSRFEGDVEAEYRRGIVRGLEIAVEVTHDLIGSAADEGDRRRRLP